MTTLTGSIFYLSFDGVEISGIYRSFTPGVQDETAEGSAARSEVRNHVKTLTKVEPKGKFIVNSADTAMLAVLVRGNAGTLIWGEQGDASGKPRAGIAAQISKAEMTHEYDKEVEIDVEWYVTADTWTYDPATSTFP